MLVSLERCDVRPLILWLNKRDEHLKIGIVLVWEWHLCGVVHLLLVLLKESVVDLGLRWSQGWGGDKFLNQVSSVMKALRR
jgi:hypothetical protein